MLEFILEGIVVLKKSKQWICKFIVLFIFMTGMCFEEIKADSVLACAVISDVSMYIQTIDADDVEIEAGAAEMLVSPSSSIGRQIVHPMTAGKRTLRLSVAILYVTTLIWLLFNSNATSVILQIPERMCKTIVVNYIHNTDGKKRV